MSTLNKLVKLRNIKRALEIKPDQDVSYELSGRVRKFRSYKSINFVDLIDGSTSKHIQTIVKKDLLRKPEIGSYLACRGKLIESSGPKQDVEFKVEKVDYLGACDPFSYPLATSDDLPVNTIRKYAHLRPRAPQFASLLRIRSEMELSLHMIMKQMDFFRVHTPTLTSNDSEASSDLFAVKRTKLHDITQTGNINDGTESKQESDDESSERIVREDYFNKDVFLITSGQLHLESLAASLSRVYTISPAFRAETSLTKRHLCEFIMFETEEANLTELEPLMNRVESIVKFVGSFLAHVSEHRSDLDSLLGTNSNGGIFEKLTTKPYIRLPYSEALEILRNKTDFSGSTEYGSDIGRTQERMLLDYCDNVPIFITNYPKHLKPFYMKCDANDKEAQCFDLIAPHGGEICGGSLREDSLEKLESNLRAALSRVSETRTGQQQHQPFGTAPASKLSRGTNFEGHQRSSHQQIINDNHLDSEAQVGKVGPTNHQPHHDEFQDFNWYLDSRRFGSYPHGGFGIGFERLVQALLGIKNIRDTTGFPRWAGHCPM